MKKTSDFKLQWDVIFIPGNATGLAGSVPLRLILDTGSAHTVLSPDVVDLLGYSARDAERVTSVTSAIGKEQGYLLRIRRFRTLGFSKDDFPVHVFDLPERYDFDGLVGISFLRDFNCEIRFGEGKLLVEPVAK